MPPPEPVAVDPPSAIPRPWLTQWWLDLAFVHWATAFVDEYGPLGDPLRPF